MDIKEHCQDVLKFLSPLFGPKRFSLDTMLGEGDWESIQDQLAGKYGVGNLTLHLPCHPLFVAGNAIGGELVFAYNGSKFEKDRTARALLYSVGASYAKYAYHASLCSKDCGKPDIKPIEEPLRKFRTRFATSSKPEEKVLAMMGHTSLIDPLGYLLNRYLSTSKLGAYARMTAQEAQKFLSENTPFEALGG